MSLATAPAKSTNSSKFSRKQFLTYMVVDYITSDADLQKLTSEYAGAEHIYLDFETCGLDPHTCVPWLLALNQDDSNIVHVINTQKCNIDILKNILEASTVVGANLSFDLKWLRKYGIRPRKTYDVMIGGRLLTAGRKVANSLDALCKRNLGFSLDKSVRDRFVMHHEKAKLLIRSNNTPKWTEEEINYAATDVFVLSEIKHRQLADFEREGLRDVAALEMALVPVVADMEYDGIYVDEAEWLNLATQSIEERKKFYGEVCDKLAVAGDVQVCLFPELTGSDYVINLNSNAIVKKRFELMGIDVETLDKEELKHVKDPIVSMYIKYKEYDKRVGTYGPSWIALKNPVTGRIHSSTNQLVDTGRFSSSGPNIQNLPVITYNKYPKDDPRWAGEAELKHDPHLPDYGYRDCFKARPGYKFVDCDYSTMEMRILAEMSGDATMKEAFDSGLDLHSYTAAKMYNLPYEECLKGGKHEKMRHLGKTLNFAIAYGKGPSTLALDLNLFEEIKAKYKQMVKERKRRRMPTDKQIQKEAISEAQAALDAYFKAYPAVHAWLTWAAEQPFDPGYSTTLLGRRRYFDPVNETELSEDKVKKAKASMRNQGKNSPIQGGNADITKMAMVSLANRFLNENYDAMIVNVIHDELLVEVKEEQADVVAKVVCEEMIGAAKQLIKTIPIEAEPLIADKWVKG